MKKLIAMLLAAAMMVMSITACGSSAAPAPAPETKGAEDVAETVAADAADDLAETVAEVADGQTGSVGFVTFGLGNDFFQLLADLFKAKMEANGWEASYQDGAFDPTTQIEACENYIAMGVDVLVLWSVAPEAMTSVLESAAAKGIKIVAFVAPTEVYDALMISDNADLADCLCLLAAKWIDETYADAEDHSVPVAVFSCRVADTGVVQADELIKIEEFSTKAKFVKEVELQAEDVDTGLSAMENLYTTNPEIKVFLTAHNGLGMGINNYFTAISSPVTDYTGMGVFAINGDAAAAEAIKASLDGETPYRGMVLTGSPDDTANEIYDAVIGVMDGSIEPGTVIQANTTFVNGDTAEEYLTTGTVSSLTKADFE